jgi:hypothetical protein
VSQAGFLMAMRALGVSLAGFAGLFATLRSPDRHANRDVDRWRIREIVVSSFELTFVGFGVLVFYEFTDDIELTVRAASVVAAGLTVVASIVSGRPGPAWSSERDRMGARAAGVVSALVMVAGVFVASEAYLMAIMLILLLRPTLVFVRAVVDASQPDQPQHS